MLYRERLVVKAITTSVTLYSNELKPGDFVTIEHIGFKASVAASRSCRIFIEGHGYKHYLDYHSVENGVSRRVDINPVCIDDSERLGFEFVSIVANEEFEVYLAGTKHKKA